MALRYCREKVRWLVFSSNTSHRQGCLCRNQTLVFCTAWGGLSTLCRAAAWLCVNPSLNAQLV